MPPWFVTGAAGFIGAHVVAALLDRGEEVVGLDNLDPYYDPALKTARLERIEHARFRFVKADVTDEATVAELFEDIDPDRVVHLAARVGVRHATNEPRAYAATNLMGFVNVLEGCRAQGVEHLVYASSSAVYGAAPDRPSSVDAAADRPMSLYAATKRSNELLAHSYGQLHGLPSTGLRFFTVYGPWGRPDMAYYLFARAIAAGEPLRIYGDGSALRDFTYVDDVVAAILRVAELPPDRDVADDGSAPYRVLNVGRGEQVRLDTLIDLLEAELGRAAVRDHQPPHPGDVPHTCADVEPLVRLAGFRPAVGIEEGVARFVSWFRRWESPGPARTPLGLGLGDGRDH